MLTVADLEVNVLEFRQRSFQFDRLVEVEGTSYAVFTRTETENERQLRPRLVRLAVVAPLAWAALDAEADVVRIGRAPPPAIPTAATVVEVAAEPAEFDEAGIRWVRVALGSGGFVYAPAALSGTLLGANGRAALGLS